MLKERSKDKEISQIMDKEISLQKDYQKYPDDLQQKANDMDELVRLIKAKLLTSMA